jgi:membrane protein YqaA with SNARE-associated domain
MVDVIFIIEGLTYFTIACIWGSMVLVCLGECAKEHKKWQDAEKQRWNSGVSRHYYNRAPVAWNDHANIPY